MDKSYQKNMITKTISLKPDNNKTLLPLMIHINIYIKRSNKLMPMKQSHECLPL